MRLRTARLDYRFGYRGRRDRPRGSHGDGCAGRPGMGLGRCPGRESRRRSWSAHGYQDPHPRSALLQRVTSMNLFGTVIRVTPSYGATIGMGRRIAAPENVPEPSSIASPNLLSLPHRTRPEPELFFLFLISITCWCGPCGVVWRRDRVVQAQRQIHRALGKAGIIKPSRYPSCRWTDRPAPLRVAAHRLGRGRRVTFAARQRS